MRRSRHEREPLMTGWSPLAAKLRQETRLAPPDYGLMLAVVGLLVIGLVMVYSASQFATLGNPAYWFRHQLIWALLGSCAALITALLNYQWWHRLALPSMLLAILLLIAVLVAGVNISGAQRWLALGAFSFQPSELAKLLLAIYLARWLSSKGDAVRSASDGLRPFAILTGFLLTLIVLQNDLGTSLVVALLALAMFYTAGARFVHLLPALACGVFAYLLVIALSGFRRARFDAFLHPLPPGCGDGSSYQLCQGLISLGSGGLTGRGLGDSIQKAGYLPNPFTDSIFAITGEELGLIGCAAIILLFAVLAYRGLCIARRAPDAFGSLLACGITCWFLAQAAINIGSVVAAIPFTGVPLPFVSFGGSSLLTSLAAVGILLQISRHSNQQLAPELP
jgi:cell division protein FtsW